MRGTRATASRTARAGPDEHLHRLEERRAPARLGLSTCIVLAVRLGQAGAWRSSSRRRCSSGPARAVRDAVALSLADMRERGACRAPWVVPVPIFRLAVARLHAPRAWSFFPARSQEFACSPDSLCARGLSSITARRFHRAGRLSDALPGPSGFNSPEAMHSKFASPRNRVRVCGDLPAGPRSSRDWLPRRGSWPKPLPRRLERHVDQRPSILSLGRLQDLPLEERVHYAGGAGGVG